MTLQKIFYLTSNEIFSTNHHYCLHCRTCSSYWVYIFIYSLGKNFVHDQPASQEYYQNISNRIYFTTKYRGEKLDTLISVFVKNNSQYSLPDSINPESIGNNCNCDCLPFKRSIYFDNLPKEIYYLTYNYDTLYAANSGVIDIIFSFKNKKWACFKTSKLDSTEKERVENRFDTAILDKL